jgi:hypothetical protein
MRVMSYPLVRAIMMVIMRVIRADKEKGATVNASTAPSQ